jgi:STE24 endopeptidase
VTRPPLTLLLAPAGLFFSDLVKSLLLGAVFIPPLVGAFTYILQHAGPWVPLQLWAFVLVREMLIMLILMQLACS